MTDWLPLAQKELSRLPYGDSKRSLKVSTIIALVSANLNPNDSIESILKSSKRRKEEGTCSRKIWYDKWSKNELIADIFKNIQEIAGNWYDTKELREMKRRQYEWREKMYNKAVKIDKKTTEMLDMPLITKTTRDGLTIVEPANWSMGNVAPMMNTADKLARMALDMPTDSVKQEIDVGNKNATIYKQEDWDAL